MDAPEAIAMKKREASEELDDTILEKKLKVELKEESVDEKKAQLDHDEKEKKKVGVESARENVTTPLLALEHDGAKIGVEDQAVDEKKVHPVEVAREKAPSPSPAPVLTSQLAPTAMASQVPTESPVIQPQKRFNWQDRQEEQRVQRPFSNLIMSIDIAWIYDAINQITTVDRVGIWRKRDWDQWKHPYFPWDDWKDARKFPSTATKAKTEIFGKLDSPTDFIQQIDALVEQSGRWDLGYETLRKSRWWYEKIQNDYQFAHKNAKKTSEILEGCFLNLRFSFTPGQKG